MKILWTHNFDPDSPVSGIFMHRFQQRLLDSGVQVDLLYLGNLKNPREVREAVGNLRRVEIDYDIVHAQYGSLCGLVTSAARGPKRVLSLRGNDWTYWGGGTLRGRAHSRLAWGFTRAAVPRYDLVLTVSDRMASEVRSRYSDVDVQVFPSPIDLTHFAPSSKTAARRTLGLSETGRYILMTAADLKDANKRPELAKATADLVRQQLPNTQLLVASGVAPSEMPLWVNAADILICTSVTEGWPNCVKEALACDVPFVATDVSDLSAIAAVEPSCRVAQDNPEDLANEVLGVLTSDHRPQLRRYVAEMDAEVLTGNLLRSYEALLQGEDSE